MVAVDLKSLVGRLTETCRRQLEAAAGLTLSRSHYNVEIEHVLLKLVEISGSDIAAILTVGLLAMAAFCVPPVRKDAGDQVAGVRARLLQTALLTSSAWAHNARVRSRDRARESSRRTGSTRTSR